MTLWMMESILIRFDTQFVPVLQMFPALYLNGLLIDFYHRPAYVIQQCLIGSMLNKRKKRRLHKEPHFSNRIIITENTFILSWISSPDFQNSKDEAQKYIQCIS